MKVKKFGHCCLLIEEKGIRILTDPGGYTDLDVVVRQARNIDVILITHEHADHIHVLSLKRLLENNNGVRIITNEGVGKLLDGEGIKYEVLGDGNVIDIDGVKFEAFNGNHEEIYNDFGQVQNTGFFINDRLFYPGDSFHDPEREVDILALPVAGPWCKIGDAVRYALKVKPKKVFPVHDGMLRIKGANHKVPSRFLGKNGIEFVVIGEGNSYDFG
ncbi:hypothetical protein CMI43_00390 [Candidatus Pacearchaeota archaeon]|jgi:L-ascorbate metabolism protein UlaG (beta-lactamase superfamily)|nr:hypothetical protein [Candidatus Pacearchaeota archaeon]|tara:strand:+ start:1624 stop:2271 length:648 start_codon:yes stop_codon:yes gene_type:complete